MSARAGGPAQGSGRTAADAKILGDLQQLTEKMDLCKSMLNPGAADPKLSMQSEAMLAVIGFLEACAPRMVELVEAAATGILSEEVFAECLSANDRLQKLLSDVETASLTETSASTTAASVPDNLISDFDDLIFGEDDDEGLVKTPPIGGGKTTGEDEEDSKMPAAEDSKLPAAAEDSKMPAAAEDSKMPAAAAPATAKAGDDTEDDFDAFFAERTTLS